MIRHTNALGVPPDADAAAARAAFLRKLAASDFAPPEAAVAAVNAVGGTAVPLTPDAQAAEAEAHRGEVEAFAAAFWSLPPDVRRARWVGLTAVCPHGELGAFLRHLEPGLDRLTDPPPDPHGVVLADLVCELFVLPRRERAVRRAEWLAENADDAHAWADAARVLGRDAPQLAALDPTLMARLDRPVVGPLTVPAYEVTIRGHPDGFFEPVTVRSPDVVWSGSADPDALRRGSADFDARMAAWRRNDPAPASRQVANRISWGVVLLMVLVGVASRGLIGDRRGSTGYTPPKFEVPKFDPALYETPRFDPVKFDLPKHTPPRFDFAPPTRPPVRTPALFTPEEVAAFERYDPKSGRPAPSRYEEWKLFNSDEFRRLFAEYNRPPPEPIPTPPRAVAK